MSMDSLGIEGGPRTGRLLRQAVHRSSPISREGLLERLFTLAFRGLVYPQIWEDPVVDLEALAVEPHHHIVTIASGGCNVLSYLTANPDKITAVDLNRAHVALTRLKLCGARHLPGWDEFYRLFGDADDKRNMRAYARYLRPQLDAETRRYWEGRSWSGRRRLLMFRRNIYRFGLLGRSIGVFHAVARLYGADLKRLLETRSLVEQRRFFEQEISPLFEKRFVRWATRSQISLYGLGIPPAQYTALAGAGNSGIANVLHQRLERLACDFPLRENYFAWQAFGHSYAPGASGPLPLYLAERNFASIRERADRVSVEQVSITAKLEASHSGSVDRYVLLDAQDWMSDDQLNDLWQQITRTARPGARVIFRTAGRESILTGRVAPEIMNSWTYEQELSEQFNRRDRSSIYGGFHLYVMGPSTA
jgi:S-adenosylmethionine-diacylglycerol 3-amino-3-carboxypropyl transferase